MASIVHILKSQPGDEAFLRQADGYIESLFTDSGEPLLYSGSETTSGGMQIYSWREQHQQGAVVEIVDDLESGTRSINIEAPDRGTCQRLSDQIKLFMPTYTTEELLARSAEPKRYPHALTQLALGFNSGYNETVWNLVMEGLVSDDLEVRFDAATAVAMLKWPEFIEPLRLAKERESNLEAIKVFDCALTKCQGR